MAVHTNTVKRSAGFSYTQSVDGPDDYVNVDNEVFFYDISLERVLYKDDVGDVVEAFSKSGSGKIGIADSTGHYTYFDDLEEARDASVVGDRIDVFRGDFIVLTNLAKDGISYYFHIGTSVTKSNIGDMFVVTGFTVGFGVFGEGSFFKNTFAGYILNTGPEGALLIDTTFEFNIILQTSGNTFYLGTHSTGRKITVCGSHILNTGGIVVQLSRYGVIKIDCTEMKSTAGAAISFGNGGHFLEVNSSLIQSTTGYAILNVYNSNSTFNIATCYGGYKIDAGLSTVVGYSDSFYAGNGLIAINGFIDSMTVANAASVRSTGYVGVLTISGGSFDGVMHASGSNTLIQSGGSVFMRLLTGSLSFSASITGGTAVIMGSVKTGDTFGNGIIVNGPSADVAIDGTIIYGTSDYIGVKHPFTLISGILRLVGRVANINPNLTEPDATIVDFRGGTLVLNGAVLTTNSSICPIIASKSSGQSISVLSAGLSSNRTGVLAGQQKILKVTVTAVVPTSFTLNVPSDGSVAISESDTTTYNTRASMAQRLVSLINSNGFSSLYVIASQDTPGTDVYFYITGLNFKDNTLSSLINSTQVITQVNSFPLTNNTGGTIIENVNVT